MKHRDAESNSALRRRMQRRARVAQAVAARSTPTPKSIFETGAIVAERVRLRTAPPNYLRSRLEATERALAESERRVAEATRAKNAFLATMSHELRTPLNGMIGMLQVALSSAELPADVRDDLGTVLASADNLQLLLNDILDFVKIETGKLRLTRGVFDLHRTLEEVVELFAEPAQSKGLELVLDKTVDLPRRVDGDALRLRQVLTNLLSNAVRFTDRGEVVLRAERVAGDPDCLRFEVVDTGGGIAAADLEKLFQPFVQSDSSTTRRHGGSGLGLAICKQLCHLMHGDIWVSSRVDQGSTFWFTVRVRDVSAQGAAADEPDLSGCSVLSVHRNERVLRAAEHAASRLGMRSTAARSARECRAALEQLAAAGTLPDFVILDLELQDVDAAQLAAEISRHPEWRTARVVLAAPVTMRATIACDEHSGVRAVVSKPLRDGPLRACLARLRGGSESSAGQSDRAALEPLARRQARILVAEDNPINQKVALRCLRLLGLEADVVADGEAALAALTSRDYDLVLMDWMMPRMDGCEATRRFRQQETEGCHLPIVAMTANAMEGDRETCLRAGMDDYVAKPVRLVELRDVLSRWLGA